MRIDIHAHLVRIDGEYQKEALLNDMIKNGIDQRVVTTIHGSSIQTKNEITSAFYKEHPDKIIGCATINPKLDSAIEDIQHAIALPGIKMVEFDSFEDGYYPDSCENLIKVMEIIQEYHLPVKVFSGIGAKAMPHQWEYVSKQFPEVTLIYLHMGCFDYGYSCVDIVKRNPTSYIETSNQYELQIFKKAYEKLPSTQIVFGTMYPHRLSSNGIDIFNLYNFSKEALDDIFYRNAIKILR